MNKNHTYSMDVETAERLDLLAKKLHISKSGLIRLLIWNHSKKYLMQEAD